MKKKIRRKFSKSKSKTKSSQKDFLQISFGEGKKFTKTSKSGIIILDK
jgi:hypothetical protein